MDDKKIQNQTQEQMKKLPQNVQDFVLNGAWEERTGEIAQKYSLNPIQTDALANTVVLVLVGLELPDTFLDTIIADVGISRLLAEQIMNDLETRVFEYAISQIGSKSKTEKAKPVVTEAKPEDMQVKPATMEIKKEEVKNTMPEILPNNLPMVEKGEAVKVNHVQKIVPPPAPQNIPKPQSQNSETKKPEINIPPTTKPAEPVQRPIPVPRFTAAPIEEEKETVAKPVAPPVVAPTQPQSVPQKPPETKPTEPIQKKYVVDPYREPLN